MLGSMDAQQQTQLATIVRALAVCYRKIPVCCVLVYGRSYGHSPWCEPHLYPWFAVSAPIGGRSRCYSLVRRISQCSARGDRAIQYAKEYLGHALWCSPGGNMQ